MPHTTQPLAPEPGVGALLQRVIPFAVAGVLVLWLLMGAVRAGGGGPELGAFDDRAFGTIPVSEDGRVKPMDTVARNTLLQLSGKQSLVEEMLLDGEDDTLPAIVWLAELVSLRPEAEERAVFRIDDPEVLGLMGKTVEDGKYFSMNDIAPVAMEIGEQAELAGQVDDDKRSRYQEHVIGLSRNIMLFRQLQVGLRPYMLPPTAEGEDWVPLAAMGMGGPPEANAAALDRPTRASWIDLTAARRGDDVSLFNQKVKAHLALVEAAHPGDATKARFELGFNDYRPFAKGIVLYLLAGLAGLFGLMLRPVLPAGVSKTVWRSGVGILVVAFVLHTAGLLIRMWLQGRPPVTNLYSSAVFIGWAAVGFAIATEVLSRLGIASLASSIVGVSTLFIAHNLAKEGDTMGVMQAVLDSNFWLGTHVITVTLGYAATFFAGFLALLYVVLGMCTPLLDRKSSRLLVGMVYGTVCFALLFSFVGTVLGGIWADQSWGRFWGWDPKENGAVMIVLMNAIVLHARWGHLVRDRGFMCLAIVGNIITAWSWFGTNLLGVGLHSYGFMDGAMMWLMLFAVANLLVIAVALAVPTKYWLSTMLNRPERESRSGQPTPAG